MINTKKISLLQKAGQNPNLTIANLWKCDRGQIFWNDSDKSNFHSRRNL